MMTDVLLLCNREKEFPDSTSLSSVLSLLGMVFPFPPTELKKKEERHQHFSSIDITLRSDSLDLN
jgi:hypothetical protein